MRKSFSYVLLSLFVISNVSNAQNEKLSDAAKVMFSDVTTNLTNSEKNVFTDSLMLKVDKDNKLVFSNGKGKHVAINVIPKDINNDGIDEYFVSYKEEMNDFDKGRSALFTKNKLTNKGNCTFIGNSKQIYFHSSKSHMPDIVLPNSYDGIWFVYKWNDLKENYERSDSNPSYTLDDCKSITGLNNFDLRDNNSSVQNVSNQSMAGTIAPNAKVLDADEFFSFSDGVARIRKGSSWALIDSSGNFVIPYNKMVFTSDSKYHFINATDIQRKESVVINTHGKIIITITKGVFVSIENGEYIGVDKGNGVVSYINANGKIITAKTSNLNYTSEILLLRWSENMATLANTKNSKIGYVDRTLTFVITPQFDYADPFSEGLACVGKKNEFGEMKYGFIDAKGQLVIPYEFSIQPHSFHSGFSLIEAKNPTEFKYAYIDKKGEIAIKVKKLPDGRPLYFASYSNGDFENYYYAEWADAPGGFNYYMDTLGHILSKEDFLKPFHLTTPSKGVGLDLSSWTNRITTYTVSRAMGFLNLDRKTYLPPIYDLQVLPTFDNESNRILVKSHKEPNDTKKQIEGYINLEGIFVIIKAEESQF